MSSTSELAVFNPSGSSPKRISNTSSRLLGVLDSDLDSDLGLDLGLDLTLVYSFLTPLLAPFLASFLADLFCECHGSFPDFGLLDCLHLTAECCHVIVPREKVAKHQLEGIPGDFCEQGLIPDVFAQQFPAHIGFNLNSEMTTTDLTDKEGLMIEVQITR